MVAASTIRLAGVKGTRVHMFRVHERDVVSPVGKKFQSSMDTVGKSILDFRIFYDPVKILSTSANRGQFVWKLTKLKLRIYLM